MNKPHKIFLVCTFCIILFNIVIGQDAGNSIVLDGVDDGINCGADTSLDISENITIEAWVRVDSIQAVWQYHRIVDKYWFTLQQGFNLALEINSKVSLFDFWAMDGSKHTIIGNYPLNDNSWHHVAATYDGNIMKLYLDGHIESADTIGQYFIRPSTNNLGIGNNSDGNVWHPYGGQIDEVRLWEVARSQKQLQNTMYDTLGSEYYLHSDSGLVGYWRFDNFEDLGINGDGADDIRDLTFHGNHGDSYDNTVLVPSGALINSIEPVNSAYPYNLYLKQNYPNPFNPSTTLEFFITSTEFVSLKVYNLLGQEVTSLEDQRLRPGTYKYSWNASEFPSGIYFYIMQAGKFISSKKLILLK